MSEKGDERERIEPASSKGQTSAPREQRSPTEDQLLLTFLPFTKKTNSSAVIVTGWVPDLQVPHSQKALMCIAAEQLEKIHLPK